jgi:hypothetical protein
MNLSTYIQKTRFYLRDALSTAYSNSDLTDLINQARSDIITDTFCCRALVEMYTVANQDKYTFSTVLAAVQQAGNAAVSVLQVNSIAVFWSGTLVPVLDYMEWTELQAIYRSFRGYTFIPFVWGMYDLQSFYVEPIPNAAYQLEVDCTYLPNLLVNLTDVETVIPPGLADYTLVPIKACALAKINQNAYGEAEKFKQMYLMELESRMSAFPAYRTPSYYGNDPRRP